MKTLTGRAALDFLSEKGIKKAGPHNMKGRIHHWPYCTNCGLVALKNKVSRKALKAKCVVFL